MSEEIGGQAGATVPVPMQTLGLWGWWDPDYLTQAGRSDGDAIAVLPDLSGNGHPWRQYTAAAQPLFKTGANGINGKGVLLFDGTNDRMILSSAAEGDWFHNEAHTIICVVKTTNANPGVAMYLLDTHNGSSANRGMGLAIDDSAVNDGIFHRLAFASAGNWITLNASAADKFTQQVPHVVVARFAPGSSGNDDSIQVDGVEVAFDAAMDNPPDGSAATATAMALGSRGDSAATSWLKASLGPLLIYRRALSDAEVAVQVGSLRTTYGI